MTATAPPTATRAETHPPVVPLQLADTAIGMEFDVERLVGRGGFGQVLAVRDKRERRRFAIKALSKASLTTDRRRAAVNSEILTQASCRHDSVCALYSSFDDETFIYILLEHCVHGSVFELLRTRGALTEPEVRVFMRQAAAALHFLHDERDVLHRDFTAANLLIAADMTLKVADFGFARQADNPSALTTGTLDGTAAYLPPEAVRCATYSKATDMWSLGCVLVFMLTGRHPFGNAATPLDEVYDAIQNFIEPTLPTTVSCAAAELVYRLMRPKSIHRLRAATVLRQAFLADRTADVVQLTPAHLQRPPYPWEFLVAGRPPLPTDREQPCGGSTALLRAGASRMPISFYSPSADFPLALLNWCDGAVGRALAHGGAKDCVEMTNVSETADEAACRVRKCTSTFGERPYGVLRGDGALTALFHDKSTLTISGNRTMYSYTELKGPIAFWHTDEAPTTTHMTDKRNELARLNLALLDDVPPIGRRWDPFGERTTPARRPQLRLLQSLPTGAAVCTFDDSTVQVLFPDSNKRLHMRPAADGRELCVTLTTADERVWRMALRLGVQPRLDIEPIPAACTAALVDLRASLRTIL